LNKTPYTKKKKKLIRYAEMSLLLWGSRLQVIADGIFLDFSKK
jgi:hypothetical protein